VIECVCDYDLSHIYINISANAASHKIDHIALYAECNHQATSVASNI